MEQDQLNFWGQWHREQFLALYGEKRYHFQHNNHILLSSSQDFLEDLNFLKNKMEFILLLDLCGVDHRPKKDSSEGQESSLSGEVVYHLLNLQYHQRIRVKVFLQEGEVLPTVSSLWPNALWFEREIFEMFGFVFLGGENQRLLTTANFIGHPLRKDFHPSRSSPLEVNGVEGVFNHSQAPEISSGEDQWISLGPSHPATQGSLFLSCYQKQDRIEKINIEIGLTHKGIEKTCESQKYNQIVFLMDRLNFASPTMGSIGWCKAIEDLMKIQIPERAMALRMVVAELSRISDHFLCLGSWSADLGLNQHYWFCLEQREKIYDLFQKLTGARVNLALPRIGGMAYDLPPHWIADCLDSVQSLKKSLQSLHKELTRSRGWMERNSVGSLSAFEAIQWGFTGPCLRASGVNYDLRKATPYYFYGQVDFEIPLGLSGMAYDRYLVRIEEIKESLKIISQILDFFPSGEISLELSQGQGYQERYHSRLQGIKPPVGEIYSATEVANGELGFYIISQGESQPDRVKIRAPSFCLLQAFSSLARGHTLTEALPILSSLNIMPPEIDR